jgi:hypothetical protein
MVEAIALIISKFQEFTTVESSLVASNFIFRFKQTKVKFMQKNILTCLVIPFSSFSLVFDTSTVYNFHGK